MRLRLSSWTAAALLALAATSCTRDQNAGGAMGTGSRGGGRPGDLDLDQGTATSEYEPSPARLEGRSQGGVKSMPPSAGAGASPPGASVGSMQNRSAANNTLGNDAAEMSSQGATNARRGRSASSRAYDSGSGAARTVQRRPAVRTLAP